MSKMNTDKMTECIKEILLSFEEKNIDLSEAPCVLGAIMATIACQTEENFPFINFWNTFSHTYSANYSGNKPYQLSEAIKIFKEKDTNG